MSEYECHPSGRQVRADKGSRRLVPCPCGRDEMDFAATRCRRCASEARRDYYRAYKRGLAQSRGPLLTCSLCPTPVRNHRCRFCADCKRERERSQNSSEVRRVRPLADDFTPEQIEARYQRAVAQRKFEAALARMSA